MKKNKILVITIIVFLILAIACGALAYLYMKTDVFKSSQELFGKYFTQELETFQKMTDFEIMEIFQNLNDENKYASTTNVKTIYSEGGEISNPFNNLSAKLDIQKDANQNYFYANGQILLKEDVIVEEQTVTQDNEYLQAEIIKQDEQYGIRFTDAVKQFVTVKNSENLENIANEIGIETSLLEAIKNIIDGTENIISKDKFNEIKNKYLNIITVELSKGVFEKQRDAMITYKNMTTKTNAYSVSLTTEQVQNILLQILNNIKTETEILDKISLVYNKEEIIKRIDQEIEKITQEVEIPALKITVYEQSEITIRTVVEMGHHKVVIENVVQNGEIKTNINYSDLNDEQVKEYKFEIVKIKADNQEKIEILVTVLQGEEEYAISLLSEIKQTGDGIEYNIEVDHKQDITTKSIILENDVKIGSDFEKLQILEAGNYISLSSMTEQTKRKALLDLLKQIVPQKVNERKVLLEEKLNLNTGENDNSESNNEEQISQTEINKFNAQFEFYIGNELSAENVKTLLEIVKNNLNSYEITEIASEENAENKKINIKLNIEKDSSKEDAINQVVEKIDKDTKYKVMISYKETNGIIDYITITEI